MDAEKSKLAEDLSKIRMVESATNSKDGDQSMMTKLNNSQMLKNNK